MKNKWQKGLTLAAVSLTLAGCLNNLEAENTKKPVVGPNQVVVQTTQNQLSSENYRAVISNGRYQLGVASSSDSNLSSAGNIRAFEEGLLRIAKGVFPTNQYFLQEGTLINLETMTRWTGRESDDNPEGLNPRLPDDAEQQRKAESTISAQSSESSQEESSSAESSSNDQVITDAAATPIYLAQIMEKDIMVETNDGYSLSGIVIGLAMNSEYQYTDSNNVVHRQEISIGEMRERGKAYANTIVGRLRATPELRSVPISVAIFSQAPANNVVGGTFVLDGISREGNAVTDWTEHNESRALLPFVGTNQGSNDQYPGFEEFRTKVSDFFPKLNGITAEALNINGSLASLKINIVTQFYDLTEITALTQHVTDVAQNTFPEGLDLQVRIESSEGAEAVITKPAGSNQYQSQILK
ncbi:CamS family sex pheromone protein [Abiotrophia sp.]|uniref:CamS family sex pheromone protein n=1 Tax=Abiotrophia sp. TaxID=76631 RepID=UPI001CB4863F|nr:CamS family sex pheromone protein [Abiotrophia sp.]MBF0940988.1 CamS family sex pheromone protein [Abiotrophia sp.]